MVMVRTSKSSLSIMLIVSKISLVFKTVSLSEKKNFLFFVFCLWAHAFGDLQKPPPPPAPPRGRAGPAPRCGPGRPWHAKGGAGGGCRPLRCGAWR